MLAGRAVDFAQSGRLRSNPLNLAGLARRRESAITALNTVSSFRPKTVIIGAGVIGLSIAWRLAEAGCAEFDTLGRELLDYSFEIACGHAG